MRSIGHTIIFLRRVRRRLMMYALRPMFRRYGRNFTFDPYGHYTYANIEVGDDVSISYGACFSVTHSSLIIGNKVMFGPNVTIMGGDHNTSALGRYMFDVDEKREGDDLPVLIEDDVWIGAGATILKGVRIGRGSIVAAGALCNRDVPRYSVVGGVPAKQIRMRWQPEEIREHEAILYGSSCNLDGKLG